MAFQYDTLSPGCIRLLWLTGSKEEAVGFKLTTSPFSQVPAFNALSYVWGIQPDPPIHEVFCTNDVTPQGASLPVGPNLMRALKSLRAFSELPIWIDAICINQKDPKEKDVQVPFMKDIYQGAEQVIVWFGPDGDDSDLAIDVLNWISNAKPADSGRRLPGIPGSFSLDEVRALSQILEQGKVVEITATAYKRMHLPDFDHPLWKAFIRLYFREWLFRLWTFQEVMLAKSALILCGSRSLSWQAFEKLGLALAETQLLYHTQHILELHVYRPGGVPPQTPLSFFQFKHNNGEWFWRYLYSGRFKNCLLPVDHIYGLLGLAPDFIRQVIKVDYSLPYQSVYMQTSKLLMRVWSVHLILSDTAASIKRADLPTWCPDYGAKPEEFEVWPRSRAGLHLKNLSVFEEDPTNESIIRLGGVQVDTISSVINNYSWYWPQGVAGPDGPAAKLLAWLDNCWALALETIPNETEAYEAFWQALFGNIPGDNVDKFPPQPTKGLEAFKIRLAENRASIPISETSLTDDQLSALAPVLSYLGSVWRNKVFVSTAGGKLGFASRGAAQDDRICIFFGQPQLYILRPRQQVVEQYEFVSIAFVQGLMLGEEFGSLRIGDKKIFELC